MLAGGLSPYGVMGLGGNVVELVGNQSPLWIGGGWSVSTGLFVPEFYGGVGAGIGDSSFGFRVVSIPELIALPGDCTDDGKLDAADLSCVDTIEHRDVVLAALNTKPGDLDGNGDVDFADFLSLAANFGMDRHKYAEGDIDLNGGVDFTDFLILADNFGQAPPVVAASMPEPAPDFTLLLGAGNGICAHGDVTVNSSTISGNLGSGIHHTRYSSSDGLRTGQLTISSSTISENLGGGIKAFGTNVVSIDNIVAANPGGDLEFEPFRSGTLTVQHSLIGDYRGRQLAEAPLGSADANGNLVGGPRHGMIDPLLGPLTDNGGLTFTHALLPGSPAIDAGDR